jgi:hypothetical protein
VGLVVVVVQVQVQVWPSGKSRKGYGRSVLVPAPLENETNENASIICSLQNH